MARSRYEIQAHKELQEAGWIVDYKIRPRFMPRHYNVDFFGAFDLIAWKEGIPFVRWISIKGVAGNRHINKKEIEAIIFPQGNQKELWHIVSRKKKKEWVKEILS